MEEAPVPALAYAESVCFSCYRAPPATEPLKKCSGCRRVKFCSPACSKREWRDHKPFCLAFSTLRSRPHAFLPPMVDPLDPTALAARRATQRAQWLLEDELLTTALARQQTLLEGQLLWREPRCRECADRQGDGEERSAAEWETCKGCGVVHWCSEVHATAGKEGHSVFKGEDGRTQCETLRLSTEIDEFFLRHALSQSNSATPDPPALWVPRRRLASPTPLPSSQGGGGAWEAYLASPDVAADLPTHPSPTRAQIYGVWVEALAPVLSLLAGWRRLDPTAVDECQALQVLLLEETHQTISQWIPALEELQHQLPRLGQLSLLALSPGDARSTPHQTPGKIPLPMCGPCTEQGRKRDVATWQRVPLVPSSATRGDQEQRVAVVLNRSVAQAEPENPFWREHLSALWGEGTPLIWFAMTEEEARDELEAVCEFARSRKGGRELQVVWGVERNVWSGGWPRIDLWEEDGVVRRGGWWWAVR